ncbi:MAG: hypothetical protein GF388_10215 [Candidatus Aegiribacteria sp.]|nr:hypothetical protein [Candidatus Aegiribacteria sp.]MBD3295407.1 hypothetical protein [Candidatus Fermentibacteria bacterium]
MMDSVVKRLLLLTAAIAVCLSMSGCIEESGAAGPDEPPEASTLSLEYTGTSLDNGSGGRGNCQVTASWTSCSDEDFTSYTLYRSTSANISQDTTDAVNLGTYTGASETEHEDGSVFWNTRYYYAVVTRDEGGNYSWSNEPDILTPTY